MREVYVVDAVRTGVGSFLGSLATYKAHELGAHLIKHIVSKYNLEANMVDEVILGQVLTSGQGQNPARQASINGGLDFTVPAFTVNIVCGSGAKSIALGFDAIAMGHADIIIAGGQESMSNAPHGALIRSGNKMGNVPLVDFMTLDGLTDAFSGVAMGVTAENVAKKYNISREEQDEFSYNSQLKASLASQNGYFQDQIIPVNITNRQEIIEFAHDEYIRHNASPETLAKLKPAFEQNGTVTAGNSSGINDGAAILLLVSEQALKKLNLTPMVRMVNHAVAGVDPEIMGIGPYEAVTKLLKKTGWKLNEIDLVEANEAFAAQAIAVNKLLGWDTAKVNITGGSIAIGHPIGASGARIATTLLHNMRRLKAKKTIASLCIGGGMGIAISFENIDT